LQKEFVYNLTLCCKQHHDASNMMLYEARGLLMKKSVRTGVFSGIGISVSLQTAANRAGEAFYGTFLAGKGVPVQKAEISGGANAADGDRRQSAQKKKQGRKTLGTVINSAHCANAAAGQPAAGYLRRR
jgi:hypothetical protein